jgi:multidrug efflux pump subunit AcrA (membrane-fusion protein)
VRPVLSTVLQPASTDSTMVVGTVQPRYETNLGSRLLGRLIARPVNVGDLVAEGQTVAAIDPTALELAVRSAKADLSKAEALLENAIGKSGAALRQKRPFHNRSFRELSARQLTGRKFAAC